MTMEVPTYTGLRSTVAVVVEDDEQVLSEYRTIPRNGFLILRISRFICFVDS